MKNKHFDMPAHLHISLKAQGIELNTDRPLKFRPFAHLKQMIKEKQWTI